MDPFPAAKDLAEKDEVWPIQGCTSEILGIVIIRQAVENDSAAFNFDLQASVGIGPSLEIGVLLASRLGDRTSRPKVQDEA